VVPHYFNTEDNLVYVGPIPDITYYCVGDMGGGKRKDFVAYYNRQMLELFDNRCVLNRKARITSRY